MYTLECAVNEDPIEDTDEIEVRPSRPLNPTETLLRQKHAEAYVAQADQMDKLAQELIKLELAVPGLYAAVLKLTAGADETVAVDRWFTITFGCWFLALALTLISLIPRNYAVDTTIIRQEKDSPQKKLGLEDFFRETAVYKRRLLIPAAILFFGGIIGAVFMIL